MGAFLLANLPIIVCAGVGIFLLAVEMFVPGFGLPGVSGIVALLIGAWLLYDRTGWDAALLYLMIVIVLLAIALPLALRSAARGKISRSGLVLQASDLPAPGGAPDANAAAWVGREGETKTILRPSGIAEFDGVRLTVMSEGTFIAPGTPVRVERVVGARIVVREKKG